MTTNGDQVTENLTYAAFAISIAAFLLASLQALLAYLQFDNSEIGRRRCSAEVMGELWAKKTKRKFKWREWRYQVFFEVPVLYTAPPGITVGPLTRPKPKTKLLEYFWRGSDTGPEESNKTLQDKAKPLEEIKIQKHVYPIYKITGTEQSCRYTMTKFINDKEKWANVHTAEDEGCSWVLLLDALQGQEKTSREWDKHPELGSSHTPGSNHTICYLIQRKRRCWDFMPLNTTKPFATTTICHLVEIMSMLGLVWKVFDIEKATLSAEGNGYMVKSEYVPGLGILTRFSSVLKAKHTENRIIPCNEVKRLCFGEVPSLFDTIRETLQVSPGRLEASLKRLLPKLGQEHRNIIVGKKEGPSRSLIFPITFEIIAMLAKSVHLPGSRFRRLPNPCGDAWNPGLDAVACLAAFADNMKNCSNLGSHVLTKELQELFQHRQVDDLVLNYRPPQTLTQKITKYCQAVARLTEVNGGDSHLHYPKEEDRQQEKDQAAQEYNDRLLILLDSLHLAVEVIDERLNELVCKPQFREVLTSHLAAVLDQQIALNVELENASGDNEKEKTLINFYVKVIFPAAIREPTVIVSGTQTPDSMRSQSDSGGDDVTLSPITPASDERSAIWLGLMFKMWSWLFLHDFNPEDKMIERSEFIDNRLPIYIG